MYQRLTDVQTGHEANYMLPFYWQHGDHYDTIPAEVERIYQSGARAFCVESRPHKDFCGDSWWRDMDRILEEAQRREMKVWILDDDHFPTGHAAGQIKNHPELRKWQLVERHVDVMGPLDDALLISDPTDDNHRLLAVYAYPRVPSAESVILEDCRPEPLNLTENVHGHFLHFSVPHGCWRVFFLYVTRRGTTYPDYIDMLNEESVQILIDAVYEPHFRRYGKYFGTTIAGFFSDEPSFGNTWFGPHAEDHGFYNNRVGMPGLALPWHDRLAEEMSTALGCDAVPLLPALWFGMGERTAQIRHAYMDAVTKRYRDCFTRSLGGWCEAHGVQYIGHIIEDMNSDARLGCSAGHYFRSLDGQHMSGIDIVLHQIIPGMSDYIHSASTFGNNADPAFFDYVLAKLGASFAHIGTQTEERAMCEVFGAYGWAEGTPAMKWLLDYLLVRGINHFVPHAFSPAFPDPDCPPHFGAGGVDPQFDGFSALMKYGNRAAHLLSGGIHHADAAILYHADAEWMNVDGDAMLAQVPAKILYDAHIDFDILPADCFIGDSGSRVYPAEAKNGMLHVGRHSYACLIIPAAKYLPKKLEQALAQLKKAGIPVIRLGQDTTPEGLLAAISGLFPQDIRVEGQYPMLRASHTAAETADVYMFVNESTADAVSTTVTLHGIDGQGILLDLLNDEQAAVSAPGGRLAITLAPYQSVIVIFDRSAEKISLPGKTHWTDAGAAKLIFRMETAPYTEMTKYTVYREKLPASELFSFTAPTHHPEFSGRIRYTCTFRREGTDRLAIDLGNVGQTARLWCNGTDLGHRICPPYRYELTTALHEGENELVIEVSNTLANAVRDNFSGYMAIPPSGIIGPIRWMIAQ